MLEYSKLILKKVSFDIDLFEKELFKSLQRLKENEKEILLKWVENKFSRRTTK